MTGIAVGTAVLLGAAAHSWAVVLLLSAAVVCGTPMLAPRRMGSAFAVVVALTLGAWRSDPPLAPSVPDCIDTATAVGGRVDSLPSTNGRRQHFLVGVDETGQLDGTASAAGTVWVSAPLHPGVERGDRVWLVGDVQRVEDQASRFRAFLRSRQVDGVLIAGAIQRDEVAGDRWNTVARVRRAVDRRLARLAPGDAGALLAGLVTGDDDALSPERREAFLRTGTSHLTAVSGSNLALLVTMASTLGSAAGWRRRWGWQAATLAGIWGYAILVGLHPPALRAALVATGGVFAVRVGRRPDYPTLLTLAAAAMVAVQPRDLWSLSFQLSFASSLALASVLPGFRPAGVAGWIGAAVVGTLVAEIATLPLLLPVNGSISLVSVPANVLVAPWVAVAFPLAAVASVLGFVWEPAGEALGVVAAVGVRPVLLVVDGLAGIGGAIVPVGKPAPSSSLVVWLSVTMVLGGLSADGRTWALRYLRAAPFRTVTRR